MDADHGGAAGDIRNPDLGRLPATLVSRAEQLNGGPLTDDVAIVVLTNDPSTR